ncbi:MAG: dockerin type I domain-containing protein [Chloroflexota bacterium]
MNIKRIYRFLPSAETVLNHKLNRKPSLILSMLFGILIVTLLPIIFVFKGSHPLSINVLAQHQSTQNFYLIQLGNGGLMPALTESMQVRARLHDGRYLVEGTAATGPYFEAAGITVEQIQVNTDNPSFYWVTMLNGVGAAGVQGELLVTDSSRQLYAVPQAQTDEFVQQMNEIGASPVTIQDGETNEPIFPGFGRDAQTIAQENSLAARGCENLLINGELETTEGWRFGPTPAPASYTTNLVHGGTQAVQLGIQTGQPNVFSHSTVYQSITIPSEAESVTLQYWERTGGEGNASDYREIMLLNANFTVRQLLERDPSTGNNTWTLRSFDLSNHRGRSLVLYFNVYNNGSGPSLWNIIDDVTISTCTTEPSPTPTLTSLAPATPTPTATPTVAQSTTTSTPISPTMTGTATATETATPTSTPPDGMGTSTPTLTVSPTATITASPTSTREVKGVTLYIENTSVDLSAGATEPFTVPIVLAGVGAETTIGAISLEVTYDAAKVTVTSCGDAGGFDIVRCNPDEVGRVRLAAIDAEGVGPGQENDRVQVATLTLTLNATDFESTTLNLTSNEVGSSAGELIQVTTENGLIELTQRCLQGDVNCDETVGTLDALFILQYDTGGRQGTTTTPLASDELYLPSCDVNADGNCDLVDALFVLQCIIGESNPFCTALGQQSAQQNSMVQAQSILVGAPISTIDQVSVYMESLPDEIMGTVEASIYANIPSGLSGATIDLRFDPAQWVVESCSPNTGNFGTVGFDVGACNLAFDRDGQELDSIRFNVITSNNLSGVVLLAKVGLTKATGAASSPAPMVVPQYAVNAEGISVPTDPSSERGQANSLFLPAFLR